MRMGDNALTVTALSMGLTSSLVSILAAVLAVAWLARPRDVPCLLGEPGGDTTFVLENGSVLDATAPGREILDGLGEEGRSSDRLIRWLTDRYPELPRALAFLAERGDRMLLARDGIGRLKLRLDGDRIRMTLMADPHDTVELDRVCHAAAQSELDALRGMGDTLAHAVWKQDGEGRILWVNQAYLDLLREATGTEPAWPPAPLFADLDPVAGTSRRVQLGEHWFDCRAVATDEGLMVSALPADALVAAERALETFKQTMSQTFAHLTVGLAIFDRERRLAIFNPALTDLTTLPVDVLLSRPSIDSFLDALRARQMIPEPRDYGSWRQKVVDVERAAQDGTYSELWHLPGARTFRITGRPQPDGAFALLMEDISAEIGLTRRFRSEIETCRGVLDALPEAIAVFDGSGALTMTNAAYDRLWQIDTSDGLTQLTLRDAIAAWQSRCEADPVWDRLPGVLALSAPMPDATELRLDDGRLVDLSVAELQGNTVMIRFQLRQAKVSALMPVNAHTLIEARLKA